MVQIYADVTRGSCRLLKGRDKYPLTTETLVNDRPRSFLLWHQTVYGEDLLNLITGFRSAEQTKLGFRTILSTSICYGSQGWAAEIRMFITGKGNVLLHLSFSRHLNPDTSDSESKQPLLRSVCCNDTDTHLSAQSRWNRGALRSVPTLALCCMSPPSLPAFPVSFSSFHYSNKSECQINMKNK